jgi:nucleoside-diphosphate-sugar epimerase
VHGVIIRLSPSVHGDGDHGFVPQLIRVARDQQMAGYPGDGSSRWSAVHRLDAAVLFRLAVEKAPAGARLHGVGEESITARQIAEAIGAKLGVPVQAIPADRIGAHFGWIGPFFAIDKPAANAKTRALLGWTPTHKGLIENLERGTYFKD